MKKPNHLEILQEVRSSLSKMERAFDKLAARNLALTTLMMSQEWFTTEELKKAISQAEEHVHAITEADYAMRIKRKTDEEETQA